MGYSLFTLFCTFLKFDTVKAEWSIIYIEGSQVMIFKKKKKSISLKINFCLANNTDACEMMHYAAFHLGLHCLLVVY